MKKKLYLSLSLLFLFANMVVNAQKEFTVTSVMKKMSRGEQPGFQVSIPEAKVKDVIADYKKQLQANTKIDAKEINGELVSNGVVNKNFSQQPFNVYSKFLETTEGVDVTVFFSEDNQTFLNDSADADKVIAAKKSVHDFAVTEYKKIVNQKLEVQNDKLKDLQKNLEGLAEDEADNVKDIGKKQREIETYTSKIESNKAAQASKAEQVDRQQSTANEISDKKSPEYKLAVKNLKDYQNEGKSLGKDSEKMAREIDKNKAEIKELEAKNEELQKQQVSAKEKVDAQAQVVKAIEEELAGIK